MHFIAFFQNKFSTARLTCLGRKKNKFESESPRLLCFLKWIYICTYIPGPSSWVPNWLSRSVNSTFFLGFKKGTRLGRCCPFCRRGRRVDRETKEEVRFFAWRNETGRVRETPKVFFKGGGALRSLRIHTLPDSSRFDGPNPIPTIGL